MHDADARPADLIGLSRASVLAERSERTLRRWTGGKKPKLRRWEGAAPIEGGPAPVLVSERELLALLATKGQKPRLAASDTPDMTLGTPRTPSSDMAARPPDSVQVAVLEEKLRSAELRAELAAVTAERDGLQLRVRDLDAQVAEQRRRWALERADHRQDIEESRDRVRALEAELRVLREHQGSSWWRALLGPPRPTLEA